MKSESTGWEGHLARRGRRKVHPGFWCGNLKERDHVDDLDVDGRIILEWILTFSRLMTYIYIYIYICLTAPQTSRCCILYIYSTNTRTEYFKHAAHSLFFPLQNAVYFIMLPFLVPVLFTF